MTGPAPTLPEQHAVNHWQRSVSFVRGFSESHTFGIFLRLRLYGSPERQGVSSGLLGVEGGLMREEEEIPVSLLIFRSSSSLKLRRSEVCRKKPGLEESWWRKTDSLDGEFWHCFTKLNNATVLVSRGCSDKLPLLCQVQEMRMKVKHICFVRNFSPALYLHRGSPSMEDLQKKREILFQKIINMRRQVSTRGSPKSFNYFFFLLVSVSWILLQMCRELVQFIILHYTSPAHISL